MSELYCDWCSDVEFIDSPHRCEPCKKLIEDLRKEMDNRELPIHFEGKSRLIKAARIKK